jgi:4-hydroxybenzoate polyprenyltransferase
MTSAQTSIVPDSEHRGFIGWLPASWRPFASLARFDRPIGWWLLFWPCAWGVLLSGGAATHWHLIIWMLIGAIAMRGAGCVYNDIVDRDLDAQVERTRMRPLASGAVSLKAAWVWLIILSLIGLVVLLQLRIEAQIVAVASLGLIAAYPFMKRITWWPQAWLGLVFSWGSLVGWIAVTGQPSLGMMALYMGSISWVIGYDTIYALQDREDDALIGVRSSALRLGSNVRGGVFAFYAIAIKMWALALLIVRPEWLVLVALFPIMIHFAFQIFTLKEDDGDDALAKFRSNRTAGFLVAMACLVVGSSA